MLSKVFPPCCGTFHDVMLSSDDAGHLAHVAPPPPSEPAKRHHHRRYSWPPSLHLIDVSKIQIPLPNIHEDPWSHFLEPAPDPNEGGEDLFIDAGILPVEPKEMLAEKAVKFTSGMTQRWKALCYKYLRRYQRQNRRRSNSNNSEENLPEPSVSPLETDSIAVVVLPTALNKTISAPERPSLSPLQPSPQVKPRPQTELTPKQVQLIYRAASGHHKPYRHPPADRSERRSWSQPPVWLYSIKEEEELDDEEGQLQQQPYD